MDEKLSILALENWVSFRFSNAGHFQPAGNSQRPILSLNLCDFCPIFAQFSAIFADFSPIFAAFFVNSKVRTTAP